jgi:DNA polymerase-4
MPERQILHVDMDAFFAAVEQQDRPELRGKPVLVGGTGGRGVVSTASYEARAFGPRSAMPLATALRLCPQAIVLPVRMARYREVSACIFRLLEQFTPLVEPVSVDEAFLDVTGCEAIFGPGPVIAARVQREIQAATGLTASVGVAPNKFLAKLASDLQKPGGLVVITRENLHEILDPLPVDRLWGVGAATVRQFEALGMRTVGHVRRMPLRVLTGHFGGAGEQFHRLARGEDDRPVCPDGQAKSISHEVTFAQDVTDRDHLRRVVLHQSEDVAYRVRRQGLRYRSVTLKVRYPDFTTITRAVTLPAPTDLTRDLWRAASELLSTWVSSGSRPVRLIGIAASALVSREGEQLSLFDDSQRHARLDAALDALRDRFGPDAVRRAGPRRE